MSDINTLRAALFSTLAALQDKDSPMDLDRAKAVNDTAQTLINCAKVEVDFIRATNQPSGSGFFSAGAGQPALVQVPAATGVAGQLVAANVRQHRMDK